MKDKKNILIIVLIFIIIAMTVGYIALDKTLAVAGNSSSKDSHDVQITSVTSVELVGATVNSAKKVGKTSATFDVDLAYPGAYAVFDVKVINKGNKDAIFEGFSDLIVKNAEDPDFITYSVSGITEGEELLANEASTQMATITITWDGEKEKTNEEAVGKSATINFNYKSIN